jgi:uncharacterized cofD-like protein
MFQEWRRWLQPGMSVKRWFVLVGAGVIITSLALAMGLAWAYRTISFPDAFTSFVRNATLQFIPHPWREIILLAFGVPLVIFGLYRLGSSVVKPLMEMIDSDLPLIDLLQQKREIPVEPDMIRVVALGGGTGLSTLLRGLKTIEEFEITAIVTVADDGGSTGKIREAYEMPAPGDIRNCIVALAEDESIVTQLFNYRFEKNGSELSGHSFGNLFITALTQVTGSFEEAVIESSKVLATRGRVLPATLDSVDLCAELIDGREICGESNIGHSHSRIRRLFLQRARHVAGSPIVHEPAVEAIRSADLIVLGPGSLYTSVLPNLLFPEIVQAIREATAPTVYICNVATQHGETDHFGAADHIREMVKYLGPGALDFALVNSNRAVETAIAPGVPVEAVVAEDLETVSNDVTVIVHDVVSEANLLRHDSIKLASLLYGLATGHEPSAPPAPLAERPQQAPLGV